MQIYRVKSIRRISPKRGCRNGTSKRLADLCNRIDRDELEASICRDSFYEFVKRFWDEIVPEKPIWNWHIKYLCDELQIVAERVFKGLPKKYDLVINISPGSTKSTILSIMFPIWCWTRMPSCSSICASYAFRLAETLGRKSRNVFLSDKWQRLFGDIVVSNDQNAKAHFVNNYDGERVAVGTGGATGRHGDFLIIDDPLDPLEAASDTELANVIDWLAEKLSTRKKNRAICPTIMIMQRLHQGDPSADLLAKAKEGKLRVRHINIPAEVDKETRKDIRPRKLRKFYVDGLMDPVRLSREVLKEAAAELRPYGYAGQYLQHPVPLGGGMFKTNRIKVDVPPKHWKKKIRFWDKAGTADDGAYTVGLLMGIDMKGRFWILNVVRGQWDSSNREDIIEQTAELDGKKVIVGVEQEPGSGGKESAEATVKRLAGYRVRVVRPTGDKAWRADPYSVQVNGGNVSIVAATWVPDYLEELKFFPNSRYKDQVDASSGAFGLLTGKKKRIGALTRRNVA